MWKKNTANLSVAHLGGERVKKNNKKKLFAFVITIQLMGLALFAFDLWNSKWGMNNQLSRYDAGEGSYTEQLKIKTKNYKGEYEVEVAERQLTKEQVEILFDQAKEEIDASFLGKNKDVDHINQDVVMKTKYQNGLVKARWSTDEEEILSGTGELNKKEIEKPQVINATVELRYAEYKEIYQFGLRLVPVKKDSPDGIIIGIQRALEQENPEEEKLILPTKVNGVRINWKKKMDFRGVLLLLLGTGLFILVPYAEKVEKKRKKDVWRKEMKKDYPTIVGQLVLLMRVGISFSETVEKIADRYIRKKERGGEERPGFENILILSREIKDGTGQEQALNQFARRCELKEYRKLAMLLQQNMKKGNDKLLCLLEQESIEAFEERKRVAKKRGEEASTKLLFPMLGMLGMVVFMIMYPALFMLGKT